MGLFRRKRDKDAEAAVDTEQVSPAANQSDAQAPEAPELTGATAAQPRDDSASAAADRPAERAAHGAGEGAQASDEELGPYDARTLTSRAGLVDLGAILLPGIRGLVVSMEMDQNTGDVTAVRIHLGESQLQVQRSRRPSPAASGTRSARRSRRRSPRRAAAPPRRRVRSARNSSCGCPVAAPTGGP